MFRELLSFKIAPLDPDFRVPENLQEMPAMLETRVEEWTRNWVQKGEAAMLLRLLERRFGPLPGWATDRVRTPDATGLEEWGLRLLDATSLSEVLGEPPA